MRTKKKKKKKKKKKTPRKGGCCLLLACKDAEGFEFGGENGCCVFRLWVARGRELASLERLPDVNSIFH
jgi:hypothetical protein